ncbi:MAG: DcaP family trimeric outer membrane transporter [Pseudomonadota bacterium]
MNTLKSLLLGSAATLVMAAGAQAASAPASFDKYTPTIDCPTGFWNTTGTDVCLRVSGFARLGVAAQSDDLTYKSLFPGTSNSPNNVANVQDNSFWYTDARLRFDARRNTDAGLLRTYVEVQARDSGTNTGGSLDLRLAFIQLGNWVFGKAVSAFTHGASTPNGADPTPTGHTIRIAQVRYTYTIGNGLSLALALENPNYEDQAGSACALALTSVTAARVNCSNRGLSWGAGSGGNEVPTFVAALNYASGPLDTQLSVAVVDNDYGQTFFPRNTAAAATTGVQQALYGSPTDSVGYAVGFGIGYELTEVINLFGKVVYSDQASMYQMDWVGSSSTNANEEIFALQGGASYEVTEDLTLQVVGGWAQIDSNFGAPSAAYIAGAAAVGGGLAPVTLAGLPVEGDTWHVQGMFSWRPIDGVDIIGEVVYQEFDWALTSNAVGDDRNDLLGALQIQAELN